MLVMAYTLVDAVGGAFGADTTWLVPGGRFRVSCTGMWLHVLKLLDFTSFQDMEWTSWDKAKESFLSLRIPVPAPTAHIYFLIVYEGLFRWPVQ